MFALHHHYLSQITKDNKQVAAVAVKTSRRLKNTFREYFLVSCVSFVDPITSPDMLDMRKLLQVIVACALVALAECAEKPNIVIIMADDMVSKE